MSATQDEEFNMSLGDTAGPRVKKPTELSQDNRNILTCALVNHPDKNHTKDMDGAVGPVGQRKGKGGVRWR